jgi:hypothetical protein
LLLQSKKEKRQTTAEKPVADILVNPTVGKQLRLSVLQSEAFFRTDQSSDTPDPSGSASSQTKDTSPSVIMDPNTVSTVKTVVSEEQKCNQSEKFSFPQAQEQVSGLRRLFLEARFSRVHGRFIFPVIMLSDKYICRASTLSIQVDYIYIFFNDSW